MSWMFQLVRSNTVDRKDDMSALLDTLFARYNAGSGSQVHWEDSMPMIIKMVLPYDSGFSGPAVIEELQKLLKPGEWMVFAETTASDVMGDPVRIHACTDASMASLCSKELTYLIMDLIGKAEEIAHNVVDS
jgi:hypothetical protein